MASRSYNSGIKGIDDRSIDFATDTIKVMLINSSYAHDPDHDFVADVVANEVPSTRQTLGSKTITKDDTNDRSVFDGADVTFTAVAGGATIGGAIVFKDTGNDATSTLLAFIDVANTATNGSNITIQWSANGIFYKQI